MTDANEAAKPHGELSTRYFTRFYIPFILSLLAILFIVVLINISPGLSLKAAADFSSMRSGNGRGN